MGYREIWEAGIERIRSIDMEPYIDLSAETHSQNRINRRHMDSYVFEMRVMDSGPADLTTTLFGKQLRAPVIASALCHSRILNKLGPWDPHYLDQMAAGIADAGSMLAVGMVELDELDRMVNQGAPVIHIVKPYKDHDLVLKHIERAEKLGCVAVGMDVDVFFLEKDWDEDPFPITLGNQTMDDMRRYRKATKLPFIVKGVHSVHDARKAREIGADAFIVSFHGGETIDYAMPVLYALQLVRKEFREIPILVDTGFRRGTDVLKGLALGANGVGLATLLMVACAGGGRAAVAGMMEAIYGELSRTMSITGCRSVATIDPSILHRVDA